MGYCAWLRELDCEISSSPIFGEHLGSYFVSTIVLLNSTPMNKHFGIFHWIKKNSLTREGNE